MENVNINTLQVTTNYEIFDLYNMNRDVIENSKPFKDLVRSMKDHGFISAYPLHCRAGMDGKLEVKGGHHRLAAAQHLGLPVSYVVTNDSASVRALEKAGPGKWKPSDYLRSYCRQGLPAYLELKDYMDRTGIKLSNAASMFHGNMAGSGNYLQYDRFQEGRFEIRDRKHPGDVADIVMALKSLNAKCAGDNLFVKGISKSLKTPEVKKNRLLTKSQKYFHLYEKQKNLENYLGNIELVYNYKCQNGSKLNLAFLAQRAAEERNAFRKK
jgi:hypothetical protein